MNTTIEAAAAAAALYIIDHMKAGLPADEGGTSASSSTSSSPSRPSSRRKSGKHLQATFEKHFAQARTEDIMEKKADFDSPLGRAVKRTTELLLDSVRRHQGDEPWLTYEFSRLLVSFLVQVMNILARDQRWLDGGKKGDRAKPRGGPDPLNSMTDQRKIGLLNRYTAAVARLSVKGDLVAFEHFEHLTFELLVALLNRAPTGRELTKMLFIGIDE